MGANPGLAGVPQQARPVEPTMGPPAASAGPRRADDAAAWPGLMALRRDAELGFLERKARQLLRHGGVPLGPLPFPRQCKSRPGGSCRYPTTGGNAEGSRIQPAPRLAWPPLWSERHPGSVSREGLARPQGWQPQPRALSPRFSFAALCVAAPVQGAARGARGFSHLECKILFNASAFCMAGVPNTMT